MSSVQELAAAILIVSDTASQDPSTDKAEAILRKTFEDDSNVKWKIAGTAIVPDDVLQIQKYLKKWSDSGEDGLVNLIVTTGGTGFAVKDVTPEAVENLLDKKAPGLVHAMLAKSLEITPFAMMSRLTAGTRKRTVIVTVPGSPKGSRENLEAVLKLLPHACVQAAGASSRSLHAGGVEKLEKDAGVQSKEPSKLAGHSHNHSHHSHGHGHGHAHGHQIPKAHTVPSERPQSNDPLLGPTRRYRESPYPMLPVSEAVTKVISETALPKTVDHPVDESLVGYTLAEDVTASEAVPAFRASIVDGYAVIAGDGAPSTKGVFPVVSVSHAAPGQIPALQKGEIARITTGAPLPPGATSVVMVEDTVLKTMTADEKEEAEVEILTDQITPGENVRETGSDIRLGEVILKKGELISAVGGELGLLASVGRAKVKVYQKPIVGVMSTGDEIVPHDNGQDLKLGQVRDCNRLTVMAAIKGWGFETVDLGIAKDTGDALEISLRIAFRRCTHVVTTGGVSMGELDLLKPTLERKFGAKIHFGRVAMKPGKPTTFTTVPFKNADGDPESRLVFSLPGNPASAVVCAGLFVLPSLRTSSGDLESLRAGLPSSELWKVAGLPRIDVELDGDLRCDKVREEYQRVTLQPRGTTFVAQTTGMQRSSRIGSFRKANALVILPAGGGTITKGSKVPALLLGSLSS